MQFNDSVFGLITIDNPLVLDLLASPSMVRLKEIDQAGYVHPFRPTEDKVTRFEHSLGVYWLLKLFNAPFEEQLAGLIHDVSHTVFSHCADYLGSHEAQQKQTYQDDVFDEFVRKSEIPSILSRYGIDVSSLLDDSLFPLKETSLPDLCADRIDYSLRNAIAAHAYTQEEVLSLLRSLSTENSKWLFHTVDAGLQFATLFAYMNTNLYTPLESAAMLHTVGCALRYALDKGFLTFDDLYTTDQHVLDVLFHYASEDPDLQILVDRMNNRVPFAHDPENFHAIVFCKSRVVDPLCRSSTGIGRLSEFHPQWKSILQKEMAPKSYCIRFGN